MKITPNEIDSIQEAGQLDGAPVRMIKTKGGFWIAVGKPKGKFKEEAISAGSHPAIVRYNLEKTFPGFQPAMMKSEFFSDNAQVEKHSHHLDDSLRKSGHDIYSVQEGDSINFHITKHNLKVASVGAMLEENFLIIKTLEAPKEFAKALAGASVEKAISCKSGLKFLGRKDVR